MKSKCLMIQGTASSVGKSIITTGLCTIFKQDGYKVAPFKSQNMALNSYITKDGKEMGRAQVVQAEACGIEPDVSMNPVLLKPTTDKKAQIIIKGQVLGNMSAMEYHEFKPKLKEMVREVYNGLAAENDVIVIEGAGSPAEINLRENDMVNMGMAEIADAPVIIVGDIDKGGVFASLAGTMLLLTDSEKARVKGVIINKFRGDLEILKPGLKMLEDIIKVPVLGVIPYYKNYIEDEDSLAERFIKTTEELGGLINIVVIKLPHMSNFTDFNFLESVEGVSVRFITDFQKIGRPDLIVLPGTKNTIEDLLYIRKTRIEGEIIRLYNDGVKVVGICGGYQMLGRNIEDPYGVESDLKYIDGIGLLNTNTTMNKEKTKTQVTANIISNVGIFEGLVGVEVTGYEIHMGTTKYNQDSKESIIINKSLDTEVKENGGITDIEGNVFGTYIHGIFDNEDFTYGIINNLRREKGLDPVTKTGTSFKSFKENEYKKLADVLRENLDMELIREIVLGV